MEQHLLHIFNPWHDLALANNRSNYLPPASALKMADDLSLLPAWIAGPGDFVLTENALSRVGKADEAALILENCTFVEPSALDSFLVEPKPWGWDLPLHRILRKLSPELNLPSLEELEAIRSLSSRSLAVQVLSELNLMELPYVTGESFLCSQVVQIEPLIEKYHDVFMKQLWSSSGKGLRPIACGEFSEHLQNWCSRSIQQHGGVVLEPRYRRVLDFAMEFQFAGGEIEFCGYSVFFTDRNGHYAGNMLASEELLEGEILRNLGITDDRVLSSIKLALMHLLTPKLVSIYDGPFGVDMMIVELENGERRIHPCVEINLRFNMGQLATKLYEKHVLHGRKGVFNIDFSPKDGQMLVAHKQMQEQYPLQCVDGRVEKGYLALNPIHEKTAYRAYVLLE